MASRAAFSPAPAAQVADLRDTDTAIKKPGNERTIKRWTATFADHDLEAAYRTHLATEAFSRELFLQLIGVAAFMSYGFLDFLTVGDLATEFLVIRCLIVGPIGALGVLMTAYPAIRRYQQYSTIIGFAFYAVAIIFMIYMLPVEGAPPYIIGVLVTMIFTSCLMRVNFPIAATTYVLVGAIYCIALAARADHSPVEIIAGYFFMISVTAVAVITSYVQETRTREIWLRNMQRERDAAKIRQLLIEATAADQSKLNFLSVLTHDLRTPLHQIIGFSEIVRAEAENEACRLETGNIDQVLSSARALLKKIGQMLRYADATAGKLSFVTDDVPVTDIIDQLIDQFREQASANGVKVAANEVDTATLHIDHHHTAYALANLVDNAIHASKPGATVNITGCAAENGLYKFEISDSGCGMSAEKIMAALEPFNPGGEVLNRSQEGLGLGLSIAKQLIDRQGGALEISSAPGEGTTVSAFLPTTEATLRKIAS
ncbi:MAG: HAMP domain-containing sensor histidine kinase [Parvularculaceae bacterium]